MQVIEFGERSHVAGTCKINKINGQEMIARKKKRKKKETPTQKGRGEKISKKGAGNCGTPTVSGSRRDSPQLKTSRREEKNQKRTKGKKTKMLR